MIKKRIKKLDFNKLSNNITTLMECCGIDATKLSQLTNLPTSTISRLRSNVGESSPNLSSLMPIADFFRVTLSQLIGEEPIDKSTYATFKPLKLIKFPIPILNAENITRFICDKNSDELTYIDIDIPISQKAFAYILQGNAMEPQFSDKTLLIIDPETVLENLDYVLVIPFGKKSPILRQLMIDGDEMFLRTLNPTFNEFVSFTKESHTLLGVMIQSRKNFKNPNYSFANELTLQAKA